MNILNFMTKLRFRIKCCPLAVGSCASLRSIWGLTGAKWSRVRKSCGKTWSKSWRTNGRRQWAYTDLIIDDDDGGGGGDDDGDGDDDRWWMIDDGWWMMDDGLWWWWWWWWWLMMDDGWWMMDDDDDADDDDDGWWWMMDDWWWMMDDDDDVDDEDDVDFDIDDWLIIDWLMIDWWLIDGWLLIYWWWMIDDGWWMMIEHVWSNNSVRVLPLSSLASDILSPGGMLNQGGNADDLQLRGVFSRCWMIAGYCTYSFSIMIIVIFLSVFGFLHHLL